MISGNKFLLLSVWHIDCGCTADRDLHVYNKLSIHFLPFYCHLAVRSILCSLHPCYCINELRADNYVRVTRLVLVRVDTCQCLIEPASDTVEAVVDVASSTIPVLPCEVCSIVKHI